MSQYIRNSPEIWRSAYPVPAPDGHKYHRGHVGVISGGPGSTGAARLAAGAALRIGAGLVTLLSPGSAMMVNAAHLTAIMLCRFDASDDLAAIIEKRKINTLVIGPGLGVGDQTRQIVSAALATGCNLVLDADALTSFADRPEDLFARIGQHAGSIVLTPHMGEFTRLFPGPVPDTIEEKISAAAAAAQICTSTLILKGNQTVIATASRPPCLSENAPPWLATAGSGDVLAGCVAGLMAQNMQPHLAASAGVWMHGQAGENCGPGLTAEDLDTGLRQAVQSMIRNLTGS